MADLDGYGLKAGDYPKMVLPMTMLGEVTNEAAVVVLLALLRARGRSGVVTVFNAGYKTPASLVRFYEKCGNSARVMLQRCQ